MSRVPAPQTILGVIIGALFIGVALWMFIVASSEAHSTAGEVRLFSALTGAYGLWRIIKSAMLIKKGEENS